MCVIIAKPAGVKMPSAEVLQAAAKANPHGFGFVTPRRYFKTLDASRFIDELTASVSDDEPCIMHFRLATHGSIKAANCHPFKSGKVFFAHNGIFDITPDGDKTDSQTAFEQVVMPLIRAHGYGSDEVRRAAHRLNGGWSKIAMLKGDDLRLYGRFVQRRGDLCLYSNLRFEHYLRFHFI